MCVYVARCVNATMLSNLSLPRFILALIYTGDQPDEVETGTGSRKQSFFFAFRAFLKYLLLSAVVEAFTHKPYEVMLPPLPLSPP
jgi:hypothetical protein